MPQFDIKLHSSSLGFDTNVIVLLPDELPDTPLRSLFLLHGASDDCTAWTRYTSIERYTRSLDVAIVMPEAHLSFYGDMYRGGKFFEWIAHELPERLSDMFPCLSRDGKDRAAAGLSMGGYGSFRLALGAPEAFSAAVSLSGPIDIIRFLNDLPEDFERVFYPAFGPIENIGYSAHDLLAAAEATPAEKRPRLFMWCGTEDFLYQSNVTARERLEKMSYPLTYTETPGTHSWFYWDREIQNALKWLYPERIGDGKWHISV